MKHAPKTVGELLEVAGRGAFERDVGVSTQLVTRAISTGRLPARWYLAVDVFCKKHGVKTPDLLFSMHNVPTDNKQNAYSGGSAQVVENLTQASGREAS